MESVTTKIEIDGEVINETEYLSYSTAHEIIFTLFCIIGLCADVIIIHILFRFRRMHSIPHIFLSNWIVADACYLFLLALSYIIWIIMYLANSTSISLNYTCGHLQMEVALYFATVYFVALITVDWFISAYVQRYVERFRNYYKISIGFIWIFSLMFWGVSTGLCYKSESFDLFPGYNAFTVIVIAVFIIAIQIYTRVGQRAPLDCSTVLLTLTSAFVLFRAPDTLHYMVSLLFGVGSVWLTVVFMYLTPLHSACNLFLLYWLNKDFQACLRQFLKRTDQNYMEGHSAFDNADDNEEEEPFPIRISINNSNEQLSPHTL